MSEELDEIKPWEYYLDEASDDIADDFSASESSYESSDDDDGESDDEPEVDANDSQVVDNPLNCLENGDNQPLVNKSSWKKLDDDVVESKYTMPVEKVAAPLISFPSGNFPELNIFLTIFPKSLFVRIAECTNQRIQILNKLKSANYALTDEHEIMLVLGISLVMKYQRFPSLADYWSNNFTLGNSFIKKSISHKRFTLLMSKMYFNDCKKPDNAAKDYYISEVVLCVKKTFPAALSESTVQYIDECMGRTVPYIPTKQTKTSLWLRCDAKTGYTYDLNLYAKEDEPPVERIIEHLTVGIREPNVLFAFNKYLTSMRLINKIQFPAIGRYRRTCKDAPVFNRRLQPLDSEFQINGYGVMAAQWMSSKEALASNCHIPSIIKVRRQHRIGSGIEVDCPLAIADYIRIVGGVDLSDQETALYDMNRTSRKWWKKAFFKIFIIAVLNAWIISTQHIKRKVSLVDFIARLSESMVTNGIKQQNMKTHDKGTAQRSHQEGLNSGDNIE